MNISERVFQKYCKKNEIECKKIPECNEKTPDYKIQLNGKIVIVEIKELINTKKMASNLRDLKSSGMLTSDWGTTGKRVRYCIDSAKPQLKKYKESGVSTALLLYQNTYPLYYLYDYDFLVGMYGLETHEIHMPGDLKKPIIWGKRKFGSKQRMKHDEKRYISAVISVAPRNQSPIKVFHNYFADYPLDKSDFECLGIENFVIKREGNLFKEWIMV